MMTGLQAGLFQLAAPRERSIQNQPNRLTRQRSRRHYEEAPGFALIYAAAGFRCACVISTFCAAQRSWAETAEKRCVGNWWGWNANPGRRDTFPWQRGDPVCKPLALPRVVPPSPPFSLCSPHVPSLILLPPAFIYPPSHLGTLSCGSLPSGLMKGCKI